MPFVKGVDADGREYWLNAGSLWDERERRYHFTPDKAKMVLGWLRTVNLNSAPADRIIPEIAHS